jgi:hypothetical protein
VLRYLWDVLTGAPREWRRASTMYQGVESILHESPRAFAETRVAPTRRSLTRPGGDARHAGLAALGGRFDLSSV